MAKFRLLRGRFVVRTANKDNPNLTNNALHIARDKKGNKISDPVNAGDVVVSEIDLVKKFGVQKFALIEQDTPTSAPPENDGLDNMTITLLRELAADEDIDVESCTKKSEFISTIRDTIALR